MSCFLHPAWECKEAEGQPPGEAEDASTSEEGQQAYPSRPNTEVASPVSAARVSIDWGRARATAPDARGEQMNNDARLEALKRLQNRLTCLVTELMPPVELLISLTNLKTVALWKLILSYIPAETSSLEKGLEDFRAYQYHVTDMLMRHRRHMASISSSPPDSSASRRRCTIEAAKDGFK